MSHKYLHWHLNTHALFKIMFALKLPLYMHFPARPHVAVALSGVLLKMSYWVSIRAANGEPGEMLFVYNRALHSASPLPLSILFLWGLVVILELLCALSESTASSAAAAAGEALEPVVRPWDSVWPTSSGSQGGVTDPTPHGWMVRRRRRLEGPSWAELGRRGLGQSPCSSCLPHPCPLHILRRAETASHAETNVKINCYDLSCSTLTCFSLVEISISTVFFFFSNKKDSLAHRTSPLLHFMQKELQSPSVLSLA